MTPPAQPPSNAVADTVVHDLRTALPPGRVIDDVDVDVARSLSRDQAAGDPAGILKPGKIFE
jgi:glycolate oxidase